MIEAFLRGEGLHQPSWRRVIYTLYLAGETTIAQDIISYAKPVEGERVCDSMLEQHTYWPAGLQGLAGRPNPTCITYLDHQVDAMGCNRMATASELCF